MFKYAHHARDSEENNTQGTLKKSMPSRYGLYLSVE